MKKYSIFRAIFTILLTAGIASTLFLFFTPGEDLNTYIGNLNPASQVIDRELQPTLLPNEQSRIALVSGHWGYDLGHTCPPELNDLREIDVNLRVSTIVRDMLAEQGYQVDLLQEFSPELTDYTGLAIVAIHTDTCNYINGQATGFKVSGLGRIAYPAESDNLNNCLIDRYQRRTGMSYLGNTVSSDPELFYQYGQINDYTTASVIETGYLNLDYRTLTEKTDQVARGIADGILCYINNESSTTMLANKPAVVLDTEPAAETIYILPGIAALTP
jgi:N-acetylmuramoyl-L-alanine amidase